MNLPHSCSTHTHAGSCTYIQLTRPKIFSEWQDRIEIVCGFTTGAVFNMNKSWIHRPVKFHYTCCFFDWQQHFERCIYLFSAQILRNVLGQAEFIQSSNSSCSISSRCGMSFPQRATRSSYKYFDTGLEFSIQAAKKKKKRAWCIISSVLTSDFLKSWKTVRSLKVNAVKDAWLRIGRDKTRFSRSMI